MSNFFESPSEQSKVKTRLVCKYFNAWSKVMSHKNRLAYIDLFCGPGVYDDGTESTPLIITKEILNNGNLSNKFVLFFNDNDEKNIKSLGTSLKNLNAFKKLKFSPKFSCMEVNKSLANFFSEINLIPSFTFIDPFGYSGVSLNLIKALTKDAACECILFFNYNRVNAAINNPCVENRMIDLFGKNRLNIIQNLINTDPNISRQDLIMEQFSLAMNDIGIKYVLPFRFEQKNQCRTSHYVIFLTKHPLGYKIMKEIMYRESRRDNDDIGTFEYIPINSKYANQLSFLNNFNYSIDELKKDLLTHFSGRTIKMIEIFYEHNLNTPYIDKDYKEALKQLESENKIITNPAKRRKNTMADHVKITFP